MLSHCTEFRSLQFIFSSTFPIPRILLPSKNFTALRVRSTLALCSSDAAQGRQPVPKSLSSYAGFNLEETVTTGKLRLDAWVSSRIQGISRARVQSSIKFGLVTVNGRIIDKVSHSVRSGDKVNCTIAELQPLRAEAEDIPLNIVFEDEHVLVVNKPAHMVVHPAPGNATGTLVNAILHHCSLPTMASCLLRGNNSRIFFGALCVNPKL